MNHRRPLAFWLLLALFVGLALWWTFTIPPRPGGVFAAIPAQATLVTVHTNLAGNVQTLIRNPAVRTLLLGSGIREKDLVDLGSNTTTRAWLRDLASQGTVIAYVPALGHQRAPAWVFASWVGGRSVGLRWKLNWIRSRDLVPVVLDHGRTVWLTRTKFAQADQRLSLALADGMLLGCVSADPIGVRWLLQTQEAQPGHPSLWSSGRLDAARVSVPGSHATWGWIQPSQADVLNLKPPRLIGFTASLPERGPLQLSFVDPGSFAAVEPLAANTGMAALPGVLGGSPDLIAVLPLAWVRPWLQRPAAPLWVEALRTLAEADGAPSDALVFAAILDREHSGRVKAALGKSVALLINKGLRVPTLLAGIQVSDETEARRRVNRLVDLLNSRYGLALSSEPLRLGTADVLVIGDSRRTFYGKFDPEERVACAMRDGWLLLASNAETLGRLLNDEPASGLAPLWARLPVASASACAWVNLRDCGKTAKDTIAAAQLALMLDDSEKSAQVRSSLNRSKGWIEALQGLEEAQAWTRSSSGTTRLEVTIGRHAEP